MNTQQGNRNLNHRSVYPSIKHLNFIPPLSRKKSKVAKFQSRDKKMWIEISIGGCFKSSTQTPRLGTEFLLKNRQDRIRPFQPLTFYGNVNPPGSVNILLACQLRVFFFSLFFERRGSHKNSYQFSFQLRRTGDYDLVNDHRFTRFPTRLPSFMVA